MRLLLEWNGAWREICELYKWWKTKRPARKSPLDDKRLKVPSIIFEDVPGSDCKKMVEPDKKKYASYYKALEKEQQQEIKFHEEDQQNLHRLIEIRPYLWT
jgi:hypothetical protein